MNQFCPLGQSATKTTAKSCPPNTVTLKTGAKSVNDCFNAPGYRYFRTTSGVRAIACNDDEYSVGLKKQTTCTKCMPGFKTDPANPPGIHTSSAVCGEWLGQLLPIHASQCHTSSALCAELDSSCIRPCSSMYNPATLPYVAHTND
jgi:hypothetical protein